MIYKLLEYKQDYLKDEQVPEGTVIRVTLKQTLTDAH